MHILKRYGWIIISCIAGGILLFITSKTEPKKAVVVTDHSSNGVEDVQESSSSGTVENVDQVMVDVKGEVQHPGVYDISIHARVDDVLALAGGLTENADELQINKAQKVHDEMMIYVPRIDETAQDDIASSTSQTVRINYASKEEIVELPGIGPSKADAIVQYREENGLFTSIEDLLQVSGIGEKTLESLREYIQVP